MRERRTVGKQLKERRIVHPTERYSYATSPGPRDLYLRDNAISRTNTRAVPLRAGTSSCNTQHPRVARCIRRALCSNIILAPVFSLSAFFTVSVLSLSGISGKISKTYLSFAKKYEIRFLVSKSSDTSIYRQPCRRRDFLFPSFPFTTFYDRDPSIIDNRPLIFPFTRNFPPLVEKCRIVRNSDRSCPQSSFPHPMFN